MKRLGPWLIVLILGVSVVWTYKNYVSPGDEPDAEQVEVPADPVAQAPVSPPVTPPVAPPEPKPEPEPQQPASSTLFTTAMETFRRDPSEGVEMFQMVVRVNPGSDEAVQSAAILGGYFHDNLEPAKAVEYLELALKGKLAASQRAELQKRLDQLKSDLNTSLQQIVEYYTVKPNDILARIAPQYDIPYQLIMRLNNMKDTNIRPDQRLRVVRGPFDVVVEKSKYTLSVFQGDKYIKSYRVGLGRDDSTPTGEWVVTSKLTEPTWYRPGRAIPYGDPENALGTRWIGFMTGYGIHGTWLPDSIGKQESEGCVRLLNEEVEELYDLLVQSKSKVTIRP